ncbi:OCIA domain-containing protein 1 [Sinocyclocheilus grahami]|uniref:OCIA domain-containing protein 1 n=1 Tax=Sinocyclocheilus grahami TaxID=75366 RepID=UPI0007AC5851|nr:PREDICTED: OCIA domain-containing protein 1-like [Sinocyclocheilus grahami]
MSRQSPADSERPGNTGPTRIDYIPTEEERRVFRECNQESFWYRSFPISVISMGFTQFLISRAAGVFGYLGGKMSYMKTCQEKFKSLESSALRQRQRHQPPVFTHKHPELSDPNKADSEPAFQLDDQRNQSFSYSSDFTYMSSATHSDTQITGSSVEPIYIEEDVQKKHILYEELRSKNREHYEVTTPKPETLLKPSAETNPAKRGEI